MQAAGPLTSLSTEGSTDSRRSRGHMTGKFAANTRGLLVTVNQTFADTRKPFPIDVLAGHGA